MSAKMYIFYFALIIGAVRSEECSQKQEKGRFCDQDFGNALTRDELYNAMFSPWMVRDYFRPWHYMRSLALADAGSSIKTEEDKFTITLDVQHFAPDEITVKTANGHVTVYAKHEEKKDEHGFISRQFNRRYELPDGVDSGDIVSQLSSDGILTITAPRNVKEDVVRVVPITQTGPARKEAESESSCPADEKCT